MPKVTDGAAYCAVYDWRKPKHDFEIRQCITRSNPFRPLPDVSQKFAHKVLAPQSSLHRLCIPSIQMLARTRPLLGCLRKVSLSSLAETDDRMLFYSPEHFTHHPPPDESSPRRYISIRNLLTCEPLRAKEASVTVPVALKSNCVAICFQQVSCHRS